jgi:hypothetical protein
VVINEGAFQIGADQAENLQANEHFLALEKADRGGSLSYEFQPPYPMLDGVVNGTAQVAAGAGFSLEFSVDGKTWKKVAEIRGPLKGEGWSASLAGLIPNGYGTPLYRCFLRLNIPPGEVGAVRIQSYQISFDLKVAPKAVPLLEAGPHRLLYTAKESPEGSVSLNLLIDQKLTERVGP